MTYGFKVTNAAGFIQVDDTFMTYGVVQTGTLIVAPGAVVTTPISNVGIVPLLFLRIQDNDKRITKLGVSASSFQIQGDPSNAAAVTVDWYTAYPTVYVGASADTFGVQVRDSSGNIVFDSRKKCPRIRQIIPANISATDQGFAVNAMPSGGKPYFLANTLAGVVGVTQVTGTQFRISYNSVLQQAWWQINVMQQQVDLVSGSVASNAYTGTFQIVIADA